MSKIIPQNTKPLPALPMYNGFVLGVSRQVGNNEFGFEKETHSQKRYEYKKKYNFRSLQCNKIEEKKLKYHI